MQKASKPIRHYRVAASLFCTALLVSCAAPTYRPAFTPPQAKVLQRFPLKVGVLLNESVCDYTFTNRFQTTGEITALVKVGDYLCPLATHLGSSLFQESRVFRGQNNLGMTEVDVLLVPRIVQFDMRGAGVSYQTRQVLAVVEWTLRERTSNRTLLLTTVEGNASNSIGTLFTMGKYEQESFQAVMDDVAQKSLAVLANSEEIRAYLRSRQAK